MKKEQTIFGENFKYVLVLTALAYIVYTLPSVRAAISGVDMLKQSSINTSSEYLSNSND